MNALSNHSPSDTPETDAKELETRKPIPWSDGRGQTTLEGYVPAEFARRLERECNKKTWLAMVFAGELAELRDAIRNLRDVKGRHHTQQAVERLISLLPENANVEARREVPPNPSDG